jgi:hypothetical protein
MIVTYRQRRPAPKATDAAAIKVPRVVQQTPRGRAWKTPAPDAEADARVAAFFKRMVQPRAT